MMTASDPPIPDGYTLLDFADGRRLEDWGPQRLIRPDPTAVGAPTDPTLWDSAHAVYEGEKGKGEWKKHQTIPEQWPVTFGDLQMTVRLAPYKHTGVFPEQEQNWTWARTMGKGRELKVLNLFAYTGGATVALAKDGHCVTHVDSSRPAITWAKENAALNQVPADRIRWMQEDASLFVTREKKRGKTYDAIIVDPPAYGHAQGGKTWRVERDLAPLLETCATILSERPAFLILNGYAHHDTPDSFHRLLTGILRTKTAHKDFHIDAAELFLQSKDGRKLSTGTTARCGFGGR